METIKWGSSLIAKFNAALLPKISAALNSGEICGLTITAGQGFLGNTLKPLASLQGLRIIVLQGMPNISFDSLELFPQLEELAIDETKQTLDLELTPSLRRLSVFWHPQIFLNEVKSNVQSLHVWNYKPKTENLAKELNFPSLREFELVQANVQNLQWISKYSGLLRLELHHLRQLEYITELNLKSLKALIITDCKKIIDYDTIASCEAIEELKIHKCAAFKSIEFIGRLQNLKSFRFMKTSIEDGNYDLLRRLEDVYFTTDRKFRVKPSDFHQRPTSSH